MDVVVFPCDEDAPYPYAEADGKALDDLFGFNLGYTITFKEL